MPSGPPRTVWLPLHWERTPRNAMAPSADAAPVSAGGGGASYCCRREADTSAILNCANNWVSSPNLK